MLLSIDGHAIASDAFVDLDGQRVQMAEIVERKFKGDDVKLHILRDKEGDGCDGASQRCVALQHMQANSYDVAAAPCTCSLRRPCSSSPSCHDFIEANGIDDLRVRFMYENFISDENYRDHPEVIVLSGILPDPMNTYLGKFKNSIVDEVNGTKIKTASDDLAAAFAKPADRYVIKILGTGLPDRARPQGRRRAARGAESRRATTWSRSRTWSIPRNGDRAIHSNFTA